MLKNYPCQGKGRMGSSIITYVNSCVYFLGGKKMIGSNLENSNFGVIIAKCNVFLYSIDLKFSTLKKLGKNRWTMSNYF